MATDGVINTTLASATVYGHIVVAAGDSHLGTGLTVKVTVPTTADFPNGTIFYIVRSPSGDGSLATVTVVDPTNPLYTFEVDTTATAGDATIITTGIPLTAAINNPSADPAAPVAAVVAQALSDAPATADIITVRAAINAMTDASNVVNAEVQLAPLAPALAAPLVAFQGIRQFQDLWMARLDMCSEFSKPWPDNDDPSCQGSKQNSAWWAKGVGYWGDRKDSGAYKGFDSRILGTMLAYDVPVGSDTRAGVGFGYSRTDIDGKTFDTSTDFDTYTSAKSPGLGLSTVACQSAGVNMRASGTFSLPAWTARLRRITAGRIIPLSLAPGITFSLRHYRSRRSAHFSTHA
jgi:hypothetical protein